MGDTPTLPSPSTPPVVGPPRPRPEISGRQLGAVAGAAVVGALLLFDRPPGVGWVLTAWLLAGAVLLARRGRSEADRWQRGVAVLAVALATLPVLTDADWVVVVTSLGALASATLAVGGGTTWPGVVLPGVRTVPTAGRAVAAAGRCVVRATPGAPRATRYVRTAAVTALLLFVFGGLFTSADAAFAGFVARLVPELSVGGLVGRTVLAAVLGVVGGTLLLLRRVPEDERERPTSVRFEGSDWVTPLGALVVLFTGFVLVQLGSLFGGDAFVRRTAGLTYATYARQGFAQLLIVAILTLAVVGLAGRYATPRSPSEHRLRRGLLAALCVLTLVVLASAFQRLALYEATYGFTRDRITAHATILWLAALFVAVLTLGAARRSSHLPRTAVALTGLSLLVFGAAQPDAIVARGNVDRFEATGELDLWLLSTLSADAAPVLAQLPPEVRACLEVGDAERLQRAAGDPLAWNLARSVADRLPATPDVPCRAPARGPSPG